MSPQRRLLLARKAELLKDIKGYEQKESAAQATLTQAVSLRQQAEQAGDSKDAAIASQAMDVAKQALGNAQKYEQEDHERLDAINRALSWPDATQPRAVVTLVRGHITRETSSGPVPFDPTQPLRLGDRISLGDDAFLEIQTDDGNQMEIGPKTDFYFDRDVQGTFYQLFQGELHKINILMGVRGANDSSQYRGLQAIAAVRGTDFTLSIQNSQDVFTVIEGEIEVDPGRGRPKVTLKGGEMLTVPKSGAVGAPAAFDPRTLSRWWEK